MRRRSKQAIVLFGGAAAMTLMWPGPSSADTSLGGYSGVAQAEAVRIQIFEPVIPIPADPQIDGGIGYAKSSTDTGPISRATASYLWPGDVIGDGFGQLMGGSDATYPVQVNSRYPATGAAPANNTAQLTDGNGMTTSSNDTSTRATVTGLGVAGPDTNLLGGIGKGLNKVLGGKQQTTPATPQLPVPVSKTLAGLATVQNVKSQTDVTVGAKTITSTAHTTMSELDLLGGLVKISGFDITSKTVSDGTRATPTGSIKAGEISIAGQTLGLDGDGIVLAGNHVKVPAVPKTVMGLLHKIGIDVQYAPTKRTADGAGGSLAATGLVISVDTQPLKTALNIGGLVRPLQELVSKIPQLGSQVAPLLGLGPKIVFRVGDVTSSATAAPAWTGGSLPTGPTTPGTGSVGGSTGTGAGVTGGGGSLGSSGNLGNTPDTGNQTPVSSTGPIASTGYDLPALGDVPRGLILGGLALAAAFGWVLRTAGGFLLGGGRDCRLGLSTGVPDLRKG